MTKKNIFQDGFTAGLRYCGYLLKDVPDSDLILNREVTEAINTSFLEKDYTDKIKEMTDVLRESVEEAQQWKESYKCERKISKFWHNICLMHNLTFSPDVDKSDGQDENAV